MEKTLAFPKWVEFVFICVNSARSGFPAFPFTKNQQFVYPPLAKGDTGSCVSTKVKPCWTRLITWCVTFWKNTCAAPLREFGWHGCKSSTPLKWGFSQIRVQTPSFWVFFPLILISTTNKIANLSVNINSPSMWFSSRLLSCHKICMNSIPFHKDNLLFLFRTAIQFQLLHKQRSHTYLFLS